MVPQQVPLIQPSSLENSLQLQFLCEVWDDHPENVNFT